MGRSFVGALIALVGTIGGAPVYAAEVRQEKVISLALANAAVAAAVETCQTKGWLVSAAVVDRAGHIKAVQRADGAGPHTVDSSRRKAYTSASLRASTSELVQTLQKNSAAAGLAQIDGLLILGGGMPIRVGDDVVGAIGVGGAPGGHLDDQCAQAGIDKVQEQLNKDQ